MNKLADQDLQWIPDRERCAGMETEQLLTQRAHELFERNLELINLTNSLEEQIEERTKELTFALNAAQESAASQRRFMAMMSHEIRTPIHGILGLIDLLLMSELKSEQLENLHTMQENGLDLLRLLNDLLELSKINGDGFSLETEEFNFSETLECLLKLFQPQAQAKNIDLLLISEHTDCTNVIGDETRIRQILSNLVSNAIKFTNSGSVTITLKFSPNPTDDHLSFSIIVEDTGIGISKEQLPKLFNDLAQADLGIQKRFGGIGLGLVIGKKLIEMMGGSIEVYSELGVGSRFEINLTLKKSQSYESEQTSVNKLAGNENKPPKLPSDTTDMVVDDNPVNRMLLEKFLKRLGIDAVVAVDGMEALAQFKQQKKIDLIFMDLVMPNMDGMEATIRIRLMNQFQPIICGLSANGQEYDKLNCMEIGMDNYLPKPLSFKDFCNYMNDISDQIKKTRIPLN